MEKTMIDGGSRLRLKILYVIIVLMGIVLFFETLAVMGYGSAIDSLQTSIYNLPQKYEMSGMQSSITQMQNQLQYQVPTKWDTDNLGTRVSSLENRLGNCNCAW